MRVSTLLALLYVAHAAALLADQIPRANTARSGDTCGGPSDAFPPAVLADCTEPIPAGVPDLRGYWVADMLSLGPFQVRLVERIEQCGLRVTVSAITPRGYSLVHDFPVANGSLGSGCHDYTGGRFPECARIHVRGLYVGDCLEMWADPSSDFDPPITEEELGARRCLQPGGSITFHNMELFEQLGRDLIYEPTTMLQALDVAQQSIQAARRIGLVRIALPVIITLIVLGCCACCACCYCKQQKKCCFKKGGRERAFQSA